MLLSSIATVAPNAQQQNLQQNNQTIIIQPAEPAYRPPLCMNPSPGNPLYGYKWVEDDNRDIGCVQGADGRWRPPPPPTEQSHNITPDPAGGTMSHDPDGWKITFDGFGDTVFCKGPDFASMLALFSTYKTPQEVAQHCPKR